MNLEELPTPEIIEELSLSEILQRMKKQLIEIDKEFSAYIESDPLVKLMKVCAYRELLLRQRINQAAKANLLAFATGNNLDNLAAFYGLTRKNVRMTKNFEYAFKRKLSVGQQQEVERPINFMH